MQILNHNEWEYTLCERGNGWQERLLAGSTVINDAENFLSDIDCGDQDCGLINGEDAIIRDWRGTSRDLNVPSKIDGHPVVKVASEAFTYKPMESVCLPEGIRVIGCGAFSRCESLASVALPDGLKIIGNAAFSGCESLVSVALPDGLKLICDGAFYDCTSLTSVTFPVGLEVIGSVFDLCYDEDTHDGAFGGCALLDSVSFPTGIRVIGDLSFIGCTSLGSVSFSEGLEHIGVWAFHDCSSLASVSFPEGLKYIGAEAFSYCSSLTYVSLPRGMERIEEEAFYNCKSLTTISFPEEIREGSSIGKGAFEDCTSLASVRLPIGLNRLDDRVFAGCTSLRSIVFPEGLREIGYGVFDGCTSLISVSFPDSLEEIDESAFYGCVSMLSVSLPMGLKSVGAYAFGDCTSLVSVSFPDSLEEIDGRAFEGCEIIEASCPSGSYAERWCQEHGINIVGVELTAETRRLKELHNLMDNQLDDGRSRTPLEAARSCLESDLVDMMDGPDAFAMQEDAKETVGLEESPRDPELAWHMKDAGQRYMLDGEYACAESCLSSALRVFETFESERGALGDRQGLALTLFMLSRVARLNGDREAADVHLRRWFEVSEKLIDEFGLPDSSYAFIKLLDTLALESYTTNDRNSHIWLRRKQLEISRALANRLGTLDSRRALSVALYQSSSCARLAGNLEEESALLHEGLAIDESLAEEGAEREDLQSLAMTLDQLADVAHDGGDDAGCVALLRRCLSVYESLVESSDQADPEVLSAMRVTMAKVDDIANGIKDANCLASFLERYPELANRAEEEVYDPEVYLTDVYLEMTSELLFDLAMLLDSLEDLARGGFEGDSIGESHSELGTTFRTWEYNEFQRAVTQSNTLPNDTDSEIDFRCHFERGGGFESNSGMEEQASDSAAPQLERTDSGNPLDLQIEDMDFSVRAYHCLKRAGIQSVRQIVECSENDLMSISGAAVKSLEEIKEKLRSMNLSLKE